MYNKDTQNRIFNIGTGIYGRPVYYRTRIRILNMGQFLTLRYNIRGVAEK